MTEQVVHASPRESLPVPVLALPERRSILVRGLWYLAGLLLCCVLSWNFLDLSHNDIVHQPARYNGDFLFQMSLTKATLNHGWYFQNPDLGAPFGQEFYDFPMPEAVHYWELKLLHFLFPQFVTPLNLFYVLGFPMAFLTAMFVLRRMQIRPELAIVGGLLYTFLPYHFLRVEHTMLAEYYPVPLACLLALWISQGIPVLLRPKAGKSWLGGVNGKVGLAENRWTVLGALAIAVLMGCTGVYYAAFTCVFLFLAGVMGWVYRRHAAPALEAGILIGIIFAMVLINVLPNLNYRMEHGQNHDVAQRLMWHSELFGLKMTQLIGPNNTNRNPYLAKRGVILRDNPLSNENESSTMGQGLSLGFLFLLGAVLAGTMGRKIPLKVGAASLLLLGGVLYGTVGGFGALFSLFISPEIRALNRISVFLAFFSALGLGMLLEYPYGWLKRKGVVGQLGAGMALCLLLSYFLWDEVMPNSRLHTEVDTAKFTQDGAFAQKIEGLMPDQACIFQLPYVKFPENGPLVEYADYEHLRMYLHTSKLRFSYGAVRGRGEDYAIQQLLSNNATKMLEGLATAGYDGLLIEDRGYNGRLSPAPQIAALLGVPPLRNAREDASFFDLRPYQARLRHQWGETKFAQARAKFLALRDQPNLDVKLIGGVWPVEESAPDLRWHWCSNAGSLTVTNPYPKPVTVQISGRIEVARQPGGMLHLTGFLNEDIPLDQPLTLERTVTLPTGLNTLSFTYEGLGLYLENETRSPLYFRVFNPVIQIISEAKPTSEPSTRP